MTAPPTVNKNHHQNDDALLHHDATPRRMMMVMPGPAPRGPMVPTINHIEHALSTTSRLRIRVLPTSSAMIVQHQPLLVGEARPLVVPVLLTPRTSVLNSMYDQGTAPSSSCSSTTWKSVYDDNDPFWWGGGRQNNTNTRTLMMMHTLEILEMALELLDEEDEEQSHYNNHHGRHQDKQEHTSAEVSS